MRQHYRFNSRAVLAGIFASTIGFCLWSTTTLNAQAYVTDQGLVRFTSRVPLHTFDGVSKNLVGRISLTDSTVDFYVDLSTLRTGIGKRDKDMRKTLETDKYPFAEFFGSISSELDGARTDTQSVVVEGMFSLHGVSRDMEVSGFIHRNNDQLYVRANWEIRLEDFRIEPPSLLVMKVDQVQQINIEATLRLETTSGDE